MIEKGMYYTKPDFAKMINEAGGEWNDKKHRPIVCLIKSSENEDLFWAIPMGKLNHRDASQQSRLNFYLNLPDKDIRSCYYHVGRTSSQSIFFISDAISFCLFSTLEYNFDIIFPTFSNSSCSIYIANIL